MTTNASGGGTLGTGRGKAILLGEHAVVFGYPALALGIDRGAQAEVCARPGDGRLAAPRAATLRVSGWELEAPEDGSEMLSRAFAALLRVSGYDSLGTGPDVVASTELPPGAGLGCSAALGVAVARALDPEASLRAIEQRVMEWERVFHGNPSGIDAAVAAHGGCVRFQKGKPIEYLRTRTPIHLCVGHSGMASSTKSMVDAIAKQRERAPDRVEKAFLGIEGLVQSAGAALHGGDLAGLGHLMDMNQMILAGLLLSTPEIEELCTLARSSGAFGAKLTGAGGGGCVVALVSDDGVAERILESWRAHGYQSFATRVAAKEHESPSSRPQEIQL
jgi:mevalonate kinase